MKLLKKLETIIILTPKLKLTKAKLLAQTGKLNRAKHLLNELEKDGIPLERVEQSLDEMFVEGLIVRLIKEKDGEEIKYYIASAFVVGFSLR